MSIYGFCNNKCKHEVYTKDEANNKSVVVNLTEPTTNEKVWIQKGRNLFDINNISQNVMLSDSGAEQINSLWLTSNYIRVVNSTDYTWGASSSNGNAPHQMFIVEYDENKNFLKYNWISDNSKHSITITTQSNTKYVRVGCRNDKNYRELQLEQNNKRGTYNKYIDPAIYTKNDNGVYEEFYNHAEYKLKGDFAVINQSVVVGSSTTGTATLDYPAGFSYDNCIPVACGLKSIDSKGYNYDGTYEESSDALNNSYKRQLNLNSSNIVLTVFNPNNDAITVDYKIVLMKI